MARSFALAAVGAGALAAGATVASAQSFNFDFGLGLAGPPPTYAAAGMAGHWNEIPAAHGTTTSGLYEAHAGQTVQRFAVNVNPRESDLARFDPELLPSQIHREPLGVNEPATIAATRDSSSYFRYVLFAVLGLLLLEPVLAWQFGRGRG